MKLTQSKIVSPFIIVLIILAPLLLVSRDQSLLFINGLHSPPLDWLIKKITWLGEGFMLCVCIMLLLFLRIKWAFVFVIGLLIHVLLIQINKQYLFNDILRPFGYFKALGKEDVLHIVEGIKIHHKTSFPSGHTTGAAFAASFIALALKNRKISYILAIITISIGFSRVYLAQHFIIDIYFGVLFGTLSSVLSMNIIKDIQLRYTWMNNYLIKLRTKRLLINFRNLKQAFHKNLGYS